MDSERTSGFVLTRRLFWIGVCIVFLLDIVGHTIDLYWRGIPVTLTTIYTQGVRGLHAEAWVFSCALVLAVGAYVARQAHGAILEGRNNND